jgi:DNA-binding NarL/FixJ family response regulator
MSLAEGGEHPLGRGSRLKQSPDSILDRGAMRPRIGAEIREEFDQSLLDQESIRRARSMTSNPYLIIHPGPSGLAILDSMLRPTCRGLIDDGGGQETRPILPNQPGLVLIGVDPADAEAEALEHLAKIRREYPEAPVILLVTRTDPMQVDRALRLGATSVLVSPLPASQLQQVVIQALKAYPGHALPLIHPPIQIEPQSAQAERRPGPAVVPGPCPGSYHAHPVEPTTDATGGRLPPIKPLKDALEGPEREIIRRALQACGWNRNETATALDICRSTLYLKMKRYRLLDGDSDRPPDEVSFSDGAMDPSRLFATIGPPAGRGGESAVEGSNPAFDDGRKVTQ